MSDIHSPVYGFLKRPSLVDFPGHLSGVFFLSGCNFRCGFCHNKDLINQRSEGIAWSRLEEVCKEFSANWVDAVVISGGEPTLSPALEQLIEFFKKFGFKIKLDTNGSRPDVLKKVLPQVDHVAMDVKCSLKNYPALTGFSSTERLKDSLELLKSSSNSYELRTTVIEALHDKDHLVELKPLISGARRYVLQPFIPRDDLLCEEFRTTPRTSKNYLVEASKIFEHEAQELHIL